MSTQTETAVLDPSLLATDSELPTLDHEQPESELENTSFAIPLEQAHLSSIDGGQTVVIKYAGETQSLSLTDFIKRYGGSQRGREFLRTLRESGASTPTPSTEVSSLGVPEQPKQTTVDVETVVFDHDTLKFVFGLHGEIYVGDRNYDVKLNFDQIKRICERDPVFYERLKAAYQKLQEEEAAAERADEEPEEEIDTNSLNFDHDTLTFDFLAYGDVVARDHEQEYTLTPEQVRQIGARDHSFLRAFEAAQQVNQRQEQYDQLPVDENWLQTEDFRYDPSTMRVIMAHAPGNEDDLIPYLTDGKRRAPLVTSNPAIERYRDELSQAVVKAYQEYHSTHRSHSRIEDFYATKYDTSTLLSAIDDRTENMYPGGELPHAPEVDFSAMEEYLARTPAAQVEARFGGSEYFRLMARRQIGSDGQEHYYLTQAGQAHFFRNLPASQSVRHYGGDPFFRQLVAGHPEYSWRLKVYDQFISERPARDRIVSEGIQDTIDLLGLVPASEVPASQRRAQTIRTSVLLNEYLHHFINYDHNYYETPIKFTIPTSEQQSYEMSRAFDEQQAICTGFSSVYHAVMERLGYDCYTLGGVARADTGEVRGRHAYVGVNIPNDNGEGGEIYIFDPTNGNGGFGLPQYNQQFVLDDYGQRAFMGEDFYSESSNQVSPQRFATSNLDTQLIAQYRSEFDSMLPGLREYWANR